MRLSVLLLAAMLSLGPAAALLPSLVSSPPYYQAWSQQVVADMGFGDVFGMAVDAQGGARFAFTQSNGAAVQYARFEGAGWLLEEVVKPGFRPDIALSYDGTPHIVYGTLTNGLTMYATRSPSGWVTEVIASNGGGDHRIRVDSQDRVQVVYEGVAGLRYAIRENGSWPTQLITSERTTDMGFDLDSNDRAHLAYWPSSTTLRYATNAGSAWAATTIPAAGTNPDLAIDENGEVHVVFTTGASELGYGKLTDTGWAIEVVDPNSWTGRWPSIDTDPLGRPHITYGDNHGSGNPLGAKTRYATKLASGAWNLELVGPVGWNGFSGELRVDPDGFPRIGYKLNCTQVVEICPRKIMLAEPVLRTILPAGVLA